MNVPSAQTEGLLLVVLLLLLWLLTRQQQRRPSGPARRMPMTEDELGRVVFETARSADLDAFRHLYLNGGEAGAVLGDRAKAYLEQRDRRWLEDELVEIGVRIGESGVYEGLHVTPEGNAYLRVRNEAAGSFRLPVGTVVRCQRIWRLCEPVGDWAPHRWLGARAPEPTARPPQAPPRAPPDHLQ